MKITVITNEKDDIVGFTQGPAVGKLAGIKGAPDGGLMAGPGQRLKEIEVPDEVAAMTDGSKIHDAIRKHLKAA